MQKNYPENTYVALVDNKIVGFVNYHETRDNDVTNTGEIVMLYVLKTHQGQGIGKSLTKAMSYSHKKIQTNSCMGF